MSLLLLFPQKEPSTATKVWIRIGGVWRQATTWIRIAGIWRQAIVFIRISGIWK
ncbi:hypothetical protein [Microcystis sp. M42BS1]|uniref:hypothetical protein n=1 Tax=Microcystis sp. M42BS1 TaxID=2771192 RepID=UPI0025891E03|nr:hypothetical protein [Microcystis sp. M42BS1]MCA2570700.1 hypothetical protein [Microcystis sp. M42BS1]